MFSVITLIFLMIVSAFFLKWFFGRKLLLEFKGLKRVPLMPGSYPIIGHGIAFSKDVLGFVKSSAEKYGKVFRMKLFRQEILVITDRTLLREFFKSTEEMLSLYDFTTRIFFDDAFSKQSNTFLNTAAIIKKSIGVNFEFASPHIVAQAEKMIKRLKMKCTDTPLAIDLAEEMIRYMARSSCKCFLDMDLNDEACDAFRSFTKLFNTIITATYILPRGFLRFVTYPWIFAYRRKMQEFFEPEIEKYRQDIDKRTSIIMRTAVDYVDEESGETLSNERISGILLALLYGSSENTSVGLTNILSDLSIHDFYWDRVRQECDYHLANNNHRGILDLPLLDACVMESARMSPHIFPLMRCPRSHETTLGEYYVGDVDTVAICSPMLMLQGYADEIFHNPTKYYPERFLSKSAGGDGEPTSNYHIINWGAGLHLCPGKLFAIHEIKIALALILHNFDIDVKPHPKGSNFFSPCAFADKRMETILRRAYIRKRSNTF